MTDQLQWKKNTINNNNSNTDKEINKKILNILSDISESAKTVGNIDINSGKIEKPTKSYKKKKKVSNTIIKRRQKQKKQLQVGVPNAAMDVTHSTEAGFDATYSQENTSSSITTDHQQLKIEYSNLNSKYKELLDKYNNLSYKFDLILNKTNTKTINNTNVTDKNYYGALPSEMMLDDVPEKENRNPSVIKSSANIQNKTQPEKKKSKIPPIVCYGIEIKDYKQKLKDLLGHDNYLFNKINKNMVHIYANNIEDFNKIKKYLKNEEVNNYHYTPLEEKPQSHIIKGIDYSYTLDDIYNALLKQRFNINIIKLFKLKNTNHWVLQLHPDDDSKELYTLKYLLNQKINIEKFRPTKMTQCKNCQRFGHVAINCNMEYRCVKCTGSHGPTKCPINNEGKSEEDKIPPRCINCGQLGHPANYRRCPKYMEILERKEKIKEDKKNKQQLYNNYTRPTITYAQTVQNKNSIPRNTKQGTKNSNNNFNFFNQECESLFGQSLFNCLNKLDEFLPQYRQLTDKNSKRQALLQLLLELTLNGK